MPRSRFAFLTLALAAAVSLQAPWWPGAGPLDPDFTGDPAFQFAMMQDWPDLVHITPTYGHVSYRYDAHDCGTEGPGLREFGGQ